MKESPVTTTQIVAIPQEVAGGSQGRQVARKHGITETTLYRWKRVYGGMRSDEAKRLRKSSRRLANCDCVVYRDRFKSC